MKMVRCAINGCDNYEGRKTSEQINFFKVPKNISKRMVWVKLFDKNVKSNEFSKVCSNHFTRNDYMLNRDCHGRGIGKACLLKGSVPTKCLAGEYSKR